MIQLTCFGVWMLRILTLHASRTRIQPSLIVSSPYVVREYRRKAEDSTKASSSSSTSNPVRARIKSPKSALLDTSSELSSSSSSSETFSVPNVGEAQARKPSLVPPIPLASHLPPLPAEWTDRFPLTFRPTASVREVRPFI